MSRMRYHKLGRLQAYIRENHLNKNAFKRIAPTYVKPCVYKDTYISQAGLPLQLLFASGRNFSVHKMSRHMTI